VKYNEQLETELQEAWFSFKKHNDSKNVFSAARTPGTLFASIVILYLVSGFLSLVALHSLANVFTILLYTVMILLTIWSYARFTGEYRDAGLYIDYTADFLWDHGVVPTYKLAVSTLVSGSLATMMDPSGTNATNANNDTESVGVESNR
jgi:atlastin